MDNTRFDRFVKKLGNRVSRRSTIGVMVAVMLPPISVIPNTDARAGKKCKAPRKKCGKRCKPVLVDRNNCGRCGVRCGVGETCRGGICCAAGQKVCGRTCIPAAGCCADAECQAGGGGMCVNSSCIYVPTCGVGGDLCTGVQCCTRLLCDGGYCLPSQIGDRCRDDANCAAPNVCRQYTCQTA